MFEWRRELVHAAIVAAVAALAAFAIMDLWDADLRIPFEYAEDGALHTAIVKGTIEGWPLVLERAGAPGDLDFRDFPALDNFNILVMRILAFFIRDPGLLINLFLLLTYPLVAASSFLVARRLGLSRPAAYLVSVLYAVLPYHFRRSIGHLFLSAYYMVPPAIYLAWKIGTGATLFDRRSRVLTGIVAIILGSSGVYYPFFGSIFFLAGGITGAVYRRALAPLGRAAALIGIVVATIALNFSPAIIDDLQGGKIEVGERKAFEAEMYGLKIAQLLLPITGHRISDLARIKLQYNAGPLITENDIATLGLVGSIGFLYLLFRLLFRKPAAGGGAEPIPLDHFSILNAVAVLVGTIGGIGVIFNLLVSPQIRSYNRLSVFIAFLSLYAFGWLFDRWTARRTIRFAGIAAAVLIVLGALDQSTRNFSYLDGDASTHAFRRYVRAVESSLPGGGAVFQLPYFPFPENGPIHELRDYEHLKAYVHSDVAEWSYGVVRGSLTDLWQKEIASLPPQEMAEALALAGFDGIWIDRRGYPDRGAAIESELAAVTGATPFVSEGGHITYLPLQYLRHSLSKRLGPGGWEAAARSAWRVVAAFREGFSREENVDGRTWRWGSRTGTLVLHNLAEMPRDIVLDMEIETGRDDPSTLTFESDVWNESLDLGADPVRVTRTLTIPPGTHRIRLLSSSEPVHAPSDPRVLVFVVRDFNIRATDR